MSKLLNLKEWLTPKEAAQQLTILFGENVTEADVLRLSLDNKLMLSVNFVNGIYVNLWSKKKVGEFIDGERAATESNSVTYEFDLGQDIPKGECLYISDEIRLKSGIYDLVMVESGSAIVNKMYQKLTTGIEVYTRSTTGIFIKYGNALFQILEPDITTPEDKYIPTLSLPEDSFLVVRVEALMNFTQAVKNTEKHVQTEATQPVNSNAQPPKWRRAFEYESEGLNALYDLIESNYFDAHGKPIYDLAQLPLKKNVESKFLTGRTRDEADTIITSGKRKGKAEK
jgi:hypothetical protein